MPITEKIKAHLKLKSKKATLPYPNISRILTKINAIPCSCLFIQSHSFVKFKFVTKVFAMKGIKIELLGIAIIPLGIAVTTNNFWGYVLGILGFGVAVVGCFLKDNH